MIHQQSTSVFTRFWNLLKPDRLEIRNVYIFAFFSGILSLGLPLGIQMIINFIQLGQISTSWFVLVCLVVLAIGFSGILNIYQLRITEILQQRIFTRTAFEFAERFPKIKMMELVRRYAPELTNRFFDTVTIQKGLSKLLIDFTAASLQIIFGLILLSFYHSFFIFLGMFLLVLLILIIRTTARRGFMTSLEESNFKYKVAHWLEEIAHARVSFKMAGSAKLYMNKTNTYLDHYLTARDNHFKILVQQYSLLIAFKVLIALSLLIVGGLLVINQQMNIGQFVAAEIIILLVLNSVEKLILSLEIVYDVFTAIEKIGQVSDLSLEDRSHKQNLIEKEGGYGISLKHVSFSTPELNELVLNDISLNINPNEKISIVSDSSVSTSILFALLTGMYEQHTGSIFIDQIPLENIHLPGLRERMGTMLYQDKLIFATISDNITFGRSEISYNQILESVQRYNLYDFIMKCPNKFDYLLNPEAHFISDDIYIKILLTRAMISKPSICLMEDPTARLNNKQRNEIISSLKAINSTLLIASHDPEIHQITDRIIQIEQGKIIFDGNSHQFYHSK